MDNSPHWKLLEARRVTPGRARTVCVANQKGGVAKTTTSVNLGAALALRGHRVLIVDVDPQANGTTGVGIDHRSVQASTYDLITGQVGLDEVLRPTAIKNLYCAPSSVDLAGAEVELAGAMAREHKLGEALAPGIGDFDLVFVDCPPSLGLLTVNALVAAEDLIVPVQCEYYALEGLGQLLDTAERIRRALNPELRIAGFLMTMYDGRTKLSAQVMDEVRSHFGELVFDSIIPRSVRLSEAPSFGEPVLTLDPSSRGAVAYRLLAAEVEARYGLEVHVPPPPPGGKKEVEAAETVDAPVEQEPIHTAAAMPGPGGRGYGTVTPEPDGLDSAWPPIEPWRIL